MRSCHELVAIVLTAATATSQMFARFETSPFSSPPQGPVVAAIDGDGDGKNDLLVANTATNAIDFYRYEGPHEFVLHNSSPWTTYPSLTSEPAFGDIDGDGDIDVLRGATIIENLGGGAFQVISPFGPVFGDRRPQLLDIDGDGDLDILQVDRLMRNDGNWTFVTITSTNVPDMPLFTNSATVLDADRDGDMDFAVTTGFPPPSVYLFRNDGTGLFSRELVMIPGQYELRAYATDMNADGDTDLAIVGDSQSYLLINDGTGSFTPQPIGLGADFDGVFVDLNANGVPQFVTSTGVISPAPIHPYYQPYPAEVETPAIPIVADLDGDLDLDVVISHDAIVMTNAGNSYLETATTPRITETFAMYPWRAVKSRYQPWEETSFVTWNFDELQVYTTTQSWPRFHSATFLGAPPTNISDVALVFRTDENGYALRGIDLVTCTTSGPTYYEFGWGYASPSPLPPIGTPTHVAAAQLDNTFGDDLVFGDPAIPGPRILVETSAAFAEQSPTLPPAAASTLPVYETVIVADMDGDGDPDIVHELRIVQNDGGGQWSVGPSITATLSPTTARFWPIDFDGDGDQDLLATGSGPTQLLENNGGTFVDITIGHIPQPGWHADIAGIGDIDRDDDDDIVLSGVGVLKNDNGVFTMLPTPVPWPTAGVALDVNFDHAIDVVTGSGAYENTHTHLRPIRRAAIGGNWELEVRTWRDGPLPQTAFVAITAANNAPNYQPLGPIGTLWLDLSIADVAPISLAGGKGSRILTIPTTPLILGTQLMAQALVVDSQLLLTGLVTDRLR